MRPSEFETTWNPDIQAIPVWADGIWYWSTMEYKWRCFFQSMGIEFIYEADWFKFRRHDAETDLWYKPDFLFPQFDMWAEVKPQAEFFPWEIEKIEHLVRKTKKPCLMLCGPSLDQRIYEGRAPLNGESVVAHYLLDLYHAGSAPQPRFRGGPDATWGTAWQAAHRPRYSPCYVKAIEYVKPTNQPEHIPTRQEYYRAERKAKIRSNLIFDPQSCGNRPEMDGLR